MTTYICNPKTGRVIQVEGRAYKSLSTTAKYKRKLAWSPKSSVKKKLKCKSPQRRRRKIPAEGWKAPGSYQRTVMMKNCGKRCFLGCDKTFPICAAGSCRHSKKGISAAYRGALSMASPKRTKKVTSCDDGTKRNKAYYNRIAQRVLDLRNDRSSGGELDRENGDILYWQ